MLDSIDLAFANMFRHGCEDSNNIETSSSSVRALAPAVPMRKPKSMNEQSVRISKAALQDFASAIFVAAGVERAMSEEWARVLIWANLRGVDSHGVLRIPRYLDLIGKRAI